MRPPGNQWSDDIWRSELVVGGDEHERRVVAGTFDRDDAEWRRDHDSQRTDAGGGERREDCGNHRMAPIASEARVRMQDDGSGARLRRRDVIGLQRTSVCGRHGDGRGRGVHAGRRYSRRVPSTPNEKLPIKMLNDRLLVRIPDKDGERRSQGGIVIPATAQMAKRLVWAEVVALGVNVRSAEVGDLVLFSPEDRYEVEVQGSDYIMLRERDLHAVAASRIEASTGLYL